MMCSAGSPATLIGRPCLERLRWNDAGRGRLGRTRRSCDATLAKKRSADGYPCAAGRPPRSAVGEPMSRPALGLGIALLAVLGAWSSFSALAPSAAAHALLVGSRPASGASLRHSPSRLLLIFTEAPDPELSAVQVLDAAGRIVGGVSNARPLPGRPAALQVTLSRPLADGVYTVVWRTVSSVDGHVAQSSFPFGVGVVAAGRSSPAGAVAGVSTALEAYQPAGRWLLYWGLALFVGAAAISWLVLGGRTPDHGRLLIAAAWLLAVAGVAVMIAAERAIVGVPLGSLLGTSVGG